MFQAWPVKIMITAASSRPTLVRGKSATMASTSPGMKPRTGNALEDVQQRDQEPLGPPVVGGPVGVDQREAQREDVGHEPAHHREERVGGQRPGREVDLDRRPLDAGPLAADLQEAEERGAQAEHDDRRRPTNPGRTAAPGRRPGSRPGWSGGRAIGSWRSSLRRVVAELVPDLEVLARGAPHHDATPLPVAPIVAGARSRACTGCAAPRRCARRRRPAPRGRSGSTPRPPVSRVTAVRK